MKKILFFFLMAPLLLFAQLPYPSNQIKWETQIRNIIAGQQRIAGWNATTGYATNLTLGAGLTISGGQISLSGGSLSDGDKGDITVSGSGATWTIDNTTITPAKTSFAAGWSTFINAAIDADRGDITTSSSGASWSIDNSAVTYAKMQNISATSRFLGRITGGAGVTEELTGTQATTLLNVFTSGLKGLVPASGGGATSYLNADGAFTVPVGTFSGSIAANQIGYGSGANIITSEGALDYDPTLNRMRVINVAGTVTTSLFGGELQFDNTVGPTDLTINNSGFTSTGTADYPITNNDGSVTIAPSTGIVNIGNSATSANRTIQVQSSNVTGSLTLVPKGTLGRLRIEPGGRVLEFYTTTAAGSDGIIDISPDNSFDGISLHSLDETADESEPVTIRTGTVNQGFTSADLTLQSGDVGPTGTNTSGNVIIKAGTVTGAGTKGQVVLGGLPTANPSVTDAVWNSGGFLVQGAAPIIAHGTYTPTITNVTNVAASTSFTAQYLRVGNTVTVSGRVDIDPTSASSGTTLGISIPIASNFNAVTGEQLGGVAFCGVIATSGAQITGDSTNDRAQLTYITGADVANRAYSFTFTYLIL